MSKLPKPVRGFVGRLSLEGAVEVIEDGSLDTLRIASNLTQPGHEIWAPPDRIARPIDFLCDWVHELCHAALAERIHPQFATTFFCRKYNINAPIFKRKANDLCLAKCLEDIWVDDLRHSLDTDLTLEDVEGVLRSGLLTTESCESDRRHLIIAALTIATIRRHQLGLDDQSIPRTRLVEQLASFYEQLPRLSYDRDSDLALLEQSVQQASTIMNTRFIPELVEDDGMMVWSVDERRQ